MIIKLRSTSLSSEKNSENYVAPCHECLAFSGYHGSDGRNLINAI